MIIKKKTLGIAAVIGMLIIGVTASMAGAANDVTIHTSPFTTQDLEIEGVYVGTFDVYDGATFIKISWDAYAFPAGVNGSYRISLWQDTTPLEAEPTWLEVRVNHHWADNPAGTEFNLGPFLESDNLCSTCPSIIVVQPETFEGDGEPFTYTPLGAEYSSANAASLTQSEAFLISGHVKPAPEGPVCTPSALACEGLDNDCDGLIDMDDPDESPFCIL